MAKARFFYAIRPDAAAADELAALAARAAARWGGRPFGAPDVHLTLAFVGMRPVEDRPRLASILHDFPPAIATPDCAADAAGATALALARLGAFGNGVLWIGPDDAPPRDPAARWPHRLAAAIRERLRDAGIAFDERPLRLHATLVRGAREHPGAGPGFTVPTIVSRAWTLALGWSDGRSTPERRYAWSAATPLDGATM